MQGLVFLFIMVWVWIWVAHSVYISLSTGERLTAITLTTRRTHPNLRFLGISLCGVTVFLTLAAAPLLMIADTVEPTAAHGLVFLIPVVIYLMLLSQFGLIFPAAALENKLRLGWSVRAIRPYWLRLLFDLARGVILFNLLLLGFFWLAPYFGMAVDFVTEDGAFSPIGSLMSFIGSLLGSWTIYLSVTALTNAYRSATARPDVSRIFE